MKTIFILSISSDIGRHLARQYLAKGHRVLGTYRHGHNLGPLHNQPNCTLWRCDVSQEKDVAKLAGEFRKLKIAWDVFISCVGNPLPVMPFFECDFDEWQNSVRVNSIAQLQALHVLHPFRNPKKADVVYFAGGGMNGKVMNFSAYTISKIMLAKMCEFLDAENKNLNVFIVGPGWTKTKIHQTILSDRRTAAGKIKETKEFLSAKAGTKLNDIFECIEWLCKEGKPVASGRNFSIAYDPWRKAKRGALVKALNGNEDMYKLRRQGNNWGQPPISTISKNGEK